MQSKLADLMSKIQREAELIQWALQGLHGRTKRIFISRRLRAIKWSYQQLSTLDQERVTALMAAIRIERPGVATTQVRTARYE